MLRRLTSRAPLKAAFLFMTLVIVALPFSGREPTQADTATQIASSDAPHGPVVHAIPYRGHRQLRHMRAAPDTILRVFARVVVPPQAPVRSEFALNRRRAASPPRQLFHPPTAPRAPAVFGR
jgi:hypothetical protein